MRLLLEGPAIEPLLERVRTEHGPGARIVHAERVRTGGVGGFFTREHFEVTVEVDPAAAAPAPVAAPAPAPAVRTGPVGLDALLAAADAAEGHDSDAPVLAPPAAPAVPAPRTSPETAMPTTTAPATPWVFPQAAPTRTPAALDAFAPATSTMLVEPDPEPAPVVEPEPASADLPPHRPMSTESTAFADLLERLQQENAQPIPMPEPADQPEIALAAPVPAFVTAPVTAPVTAFVAPPQPATEDATARRHGRRAARAAAPDDLAGRLAALGLPAELCAQVLDGADGDLGAVVSRLHLVLAGLPVPTLDLSRPGAVVLVVGDAARATDAAQALAARHRLPADAVVDLGAAGAAPTADHVRRELARLRGGSTAAVVVVGTDAVADPAGDPWLAAVARSLGADQVVACVDATRKVADLARWLGGLEGVGLAVDALDVHHVAATGDPAAVLDLGLPVLALDGTRCDAGAFAALLVGRLLGDGGAR